MDEQKIKKIYERLSTFVIDLPRDPGSLGPEFMQESISVCRNYLNETAHYLQDVLVEESFLAMRLDAEQAAYQVRSTELLATNASVAERSNIADRLAVIDNMLRPQKQAITSLESEIRILGHVKTVIRARQTELNNTMSSIRLQRSLLKDALRSGSFYGDESTVSRGHGGLDPVDELNATDLEALVAASEAELEKESRGRYSSGASDPADEMSEDALEAIVRAGDVATIEAAPPAVDDHTSESLDPDKLLEAQLQRFLQEPDEDVATLLQSL